MKLKAIAADLDGTLLNDSGKISPYTEQALLKAHNAGVVIIIASGRAFHTLPDGILSLPGVEYAVTSNGAAIYDVKNKEIINKYNINSKSTLNIMKITKSEPLTYEAFAEGFAYAQQNYIDNPLAFNAHKGALPYIRSTRRPISDIGDFIVKHAGKLESIDLIFKEPNRKQTVEKLLSADKNIYFTSSQTHITEISDCRCGKGNGFKLILDRLGISLSDSAAFGNAVNDIEMLCCAGRGICVMNSPETVKKSADAICADNNDDGVAKYIEKLLSD